MVRGKQIHEKFLSLGFKNNCGRPQKSELRQRLEFFDGIKRKRSVSLLFVGAMSGLLGFVFAGFLGMWKHFNDSEISYNYLGKPYESGHNYFPQTVSEMVHDPKSPSGKCFFAFCMIGAICIMISNYPYHLRNTYVGDDYCVFGVSLLSYRAFLPPIGMMLVACIRATPAPQASFADKITVLIHTFGAVIMIGGHAVFELHNIHFSTKADIKTLTEKLWRWAFLIGSVGSMIGFEICGFLAGQLPKHGVCCNDVWVIPTLHDIQQSFNVSHPGIAVLDSYMHEKDKAVLVNTASGAILGVKLAEYWTEVFAGIFMILGHLTIWFYAPERKFDLLEDIPDNVADNVEDE